MENDKLKMIITRVAARRKMMEFGPVRGAVVHRLFV
jgi:hypothetical protein